MSEIDPIYRELAATIHGADLEYTPRILSLLANKEQARILRALPDRDREPGAGRSLKVSGEFARKLNIDKEIVDKHIWELFEKGVVFPTKVGPQMARTWMQLHDSTLGNPKYDEALTNEFFDLWALAQDAARKPVDANSHPDAAVFRVIPKWKSIRDIPGVLPCEDMREILKAQELLALLHCGCKRSYRKRECGVPEESCINVGRTAQYNLERGVGRRITYEEALRTLDDLDGHPVVNMVINQKEVTQLVCSCHSCCCGALKEGVAASRFEALVDAKTCNECGICVDRCQFGAAQMKVDPETGQHRAYVDPQRCLGCGDCITICPNGAMRMKLVRPPEHIPNSLTIY